MGGFGSAVLEAASDGARHQPHPPPGHPRPLHRARRAPELLADLGLDARGIAAACRELSQQGEGVTL